MLILVEGDVEWHKEDQARLATPADPDCLDAIQPGKTWIGQSILGMCSHPVASSIYNIILTEAGKAMSARGADLFQGLQLVGHGLWDHPAMDPDSCGVIAGFVPIGPWPQSESLSLCIPLFELISEFF